MHKGRIIAEHKTNYQILSNGREYLGTVRGVFFAESEFPKVGDYVEFDVVADDKAVIEKIFPRTSVVARKSAETDESQVIVANVDYIFIVMGVDGDFNLSRLERYLLLAKQSDATAVVILNKIDSTKTPEDFITQTKDVAHGASVHAVSALTGENMNALMQYFENDHSIVLLGSSGAGKSTITNWLLSEDAQAVRDVRADDSRGKHTTTTRQLFTLPSGGFLIDTPGMRELGLQDASEEDASEVFNVIDQLASECRFNNCDHEKSAGCAVLDALAQGDISQRQLQSYHKLQQERQDEASKRGEIPSLKERIQRRKLIRSHNKLQEKELREDGLE